MFLLENVCLFNNFIDSFCRVEDKRLLQIGCLQELQQNFNADRENCIQHCFSAARSEIFLSKIRSKVSFVFLFLNFTEEIFLFPRKCAEVFQASYVNYFFGLWSFEICRAREAEKILGSSKHTSKSEIYNFIHPFLKTGLLTSNGEKWHNRRRMLTPAFHFDILKEFLDMFREESDKLVESLKGDAGKVLNIIPISTQFTLNTICESAMGVKLSNLGNDGVVYRNNIYEVGRLLVYRITKPWLISDHLYSLFGHRKQLDKILKPVLAFTKSIIRERKAHFAMESAKTAKDKSGSDDENVYYRSKKRRYAMMDTLLQAQRDGLIDDEGIIEETDTFTFEGHDTTSSAMTFTLLLMAHHPEAQERVFEEIQSIKLDKEDNHELTIDDFNKMEYLDRVVKESLRIYPPVPFISRNLSEDFEHDGFIQPKDTSVNIHIFDVHRDPEVFPDPEKFDPDRFLPENCAKRSNFAFIAFSAGMRNCIGQRFAMLELKMILTKLITAFKVLPVTKREEITFIGDLILRSKYPIKMQFELRK